MNSIHDMGGMHGFGPIEVERDEPPFHEKWEGRVFGMQRSLGFAGAWTIDESRAALEALPPLIYLASSYFARWLQGMEHNLQRVGLVGADELAAGKSLRTGAAPRRVLSADRVRDGKILVRGDFARPALAPARFNVGETVRMRNINPIGHTRLPRYARGKIGRIEAVRGCHVFPDAVANGAGENPQWLYTVVFSGRELWGEASDPTVTVSIEAFEPYLDPA